MDIWVPAPFLTGSSSVKKCPRKSGEQTVQTSWQSTETVSRCAVNSPGLYLVSVSKLTRTEVICCHLTLEVFALCCRGLASSEWTFWETSLDFQIASPRLLKSGFPPHLENLEKQGQTWKTWKNKGVWDKNLEKYCKTWKKILTSPWKSLRASTEEAL